MADIRMLVNTALPEVPVNIAPLVDDTDFKAIEGAVAYNAAGMTLRWHFVTKAGAYTVTSVTPTTGGDYDWTDQGDSGIYTIEIPASAGASINNNAIGFGWFTGVATGILPWRGPVIEFYSEQVEPVIIHLEHLRGDTSQMIEFPVYKDDDTAYTGLVYNTSGLVCAYYREEQPASATAVTLETATLGAYTSKGFIVVDASLLPGVYQFGLPSEVIEDSEGVDRVILRFGGAANMRPTIVYIDLKDSITLGTDNKVVVSTDAQSLEDSFNVGVPLLTTAMTESYSVLGDAPTPLQALLELRQRWENFAVIGSTLYVYKVDGSTVAYQLTHNSTLNPSSATRA